VGERIRAADRERYRANKAHRHGPECRELEGPFEFGDPTVPTWDGAR
jgi:hypothetical protein